MSTPFLGLTCHSFIAVVIRQEGFPRQTQSIIVAVHAPRMLGHDLFRPPFPRPARRADQRLDSGDCGQGSLAVDGRRIEAGRIWARQVLAALPELRQGRREIGVISLSRFQAMPHLLPRYAGEALGPYLGPEQDRALIVEGLEAMPVHRRQTIAQRQHPASLRPLRPP